jgi:hypothetical protein
MLRNNTEYAEWLINRALEKGEPRKLKRALNASLARSRQQGDFEKVDFIRREIRKVNKNCRKFRAWMAATHPGGTAKVVISNT